MRFGHHLAEFFIYSTFKFNTANIHSACFQWKENILLVHNKYNKHYTVYEKVHCVFMCV